MTPQDQKNSETVRNSVNLIKRVYKDIGDVLGVAVEQIKDIINQNSMSILQKSGVV